jgi:hypothetical protein
MEQDAHPPANVSGQQATSRSRTAKASPYGWEENGELVRGINVLEQLNAHMETDDNDNKAGLPMPQTFSSTVKPLTFAFMMQIASHREGADMVHGGHQGSISQRSASSGRDTDTDEVGTIRSRDLRT